MNNITAGVREREDANRTREAGHLDEIQGVVANTLELFRNGAVGFIDWLDDRRSFGFSVQELPQVRQQILIALLSPAVWICLQVGDKEFHEALIRVLFQDGNRV